MRINWYKFLVNKGKGYPIKEIFAYVLPNVGWVKRWLIIKYDETDLLMGYPERKHIILDCPDYISPCASMTEGKSSMPLQLTHTFRVTERFLSGFIHFDM